MRQAVCNFFSSCHKIICAGVRPPYKMRIPGAKKLHSIPLAKMQHSARSAYVCFVLHIGNKDVCHHRLGKSEQDNVLKNNMFPSTKSIGAMEEFRKDAGFLANSKFSCMTQWKQWGHHALEKWCKRVHFKPQGHVH